VASAFSAFGLATSPIALAAEISDPAPFPLDPARVQRDFEQLEAQVREAMARQGLEYVQVTLEREIDLRYSMQLAELATPVEPGPVDAAELERCVARFEKKYAELYGPDAGFREAGVQGITFRVRGTGVLPFAPTLPRIEPANGSAATPRARRPVRLDRSGYVDTPIYDYATLRAGHRIDGPAIVEVPTTTVVIPGGMRSEVDALGNLVIQTR
jgi:N-methylhydantoinase A